MVSLVKLNSNRVDVYLIFALTLLPCSSCFSTTYTTERIQNDRIFPQLCWSHIYFFAYLISPVNLVSGARVFVCVHARETERRRSPDAISSNWIKRKHIVCERKERTRWCEKLQQKKFVFFFCFFLTSKSYWRCTQWRRSAGTGRAHISIGNTLTGPGACVCVRTNAVNVFWWLGFNVFCVVVTRRLLKCAFNNQY